MTSYHLEIKSGKKGSAEEHSKYIARGGTYSKLDDMIAAGFGNMPEWAKDNPAAYWKAADRFERENGATYRELIIAIPNEFTVAQCVAFAIKAIHGLIGNKPYQYAIHRSYAKLGDVENTHIHLMYSDRQPDEHQRRPEESFARYNSKHPDRGGCKKDSGGKTPLQLRDEVIAKRKLAADIQNQMLAEMGASTRVDHRSHRERGIERQPERHLGQARIRTMTVQERSDYLAARAEKKEE
jgi:hypothetical protein